MTKTVIVPAGFTIDANKQFEITATLSEALPEGYNAGSATLSEDRKTLTCICTPHESMKIKNFIADTDPDAFATIMPINMVWGKRFSDIREVDNT